MEEIQFQIPDVGRGVMAYFPPDVGYLALGMYAYERYSSQDS